MLSPLDLDKYIFEIVLVGGCDRPRIADPQVDCFGFLLQSDPGESDIPLYIGKQTCVFVSKVVIFLPMR